MFPDIAESYGPLTGRSDFIENKVRGTSNLQCVSYVITTDPIREDEW